MEEELNKNNSEKELEKNKKTKKTLIIVLVLILVLIFLIEMGVLVFNKFLIQTDVNKGSEEVSKGEKIANQVFEEAKVLKTYSFGFGDYVLITKETEENKDGKIIENKDAIASYEKETKFVLIEKGLYKIEIVKGDTAQVIMSPYIKDKAKDESLSDLYESITFTKNEGSNIEYLKINETEISVDALDFIVYPNTKNRKEIESTDVEIRLSLLDRKPVSETDKKGTKYELVELENNHYEVGKHIPAGVYDFALSSGKLTEFVVMNSKGDYKYTVVLKNDNTDKKTFISNFEIFDGDKIKIVKLYKTIKLQDRDENKVKIIATALNTQQELIIPEEENLRSSNEVSKVVKKYDFNIGNHKVTTKKTKGEFEQYFEVEKFTDTEVEKGIYNIEITGGRYAHIEIVEIGYEGIETIVDQLTFRKDSGSDFVRLTEREFSQSAMLKITDKGIPSSLKGKDNKIKITLSLLDKKELDQTTANKGRQYVFTQDVNKEVYEVGKDIEVGSYDIEQVSGNYSVLKIKDKNGNVKQESNMQGKLEKEGRRLLKEVVLKEGDKISFEAIFFPGPQYQSRNRVGFKFTAK